MTHHLYEIKQVFVFEVRVVLQIDGCHMAIVLEALAQHFNVPSINVLV